MPPTQLPAVLPTTWTLSVSYRTPKGGGLLLATQLAAHDTVLQDTVAAAGTIGRLTPAYYGFCDPPGRDGSSKSCKPEALPLTLPILVW